MPLQDRLSQEVHNNPGCVSLTIKVPIGASGATGTVLGRCVVSVAKSTTGVYVITFDRGFKQLLRFGGTVIQAANALLHPVLQADYTSGSSTLTFATSVQAGTPTEPASGDVILLEVEFDKDGLV